MGKVVELESVEQYDEFLEVNKDKKVLLDFHASWCGPCKMLSPNIDVLAAETDVEVLKINVDDYQDLATKYEVMGIPALKVVENKEVVKQHQGFAPVEVLKELVK